MKKQFYSLVVILMAGNSFLNADITDFLRPENKREDYTKAPQESGFLHETYEDREGNVHRRFAPIEGIFGAHRGKHVKDEEQENTPETRKTKGY